MKQTSLFLEFISLQTNDFILEGKRDLYPELQKAVEEGKELFELLGSSRFNLNLHINASNRHSAIRTTGCGCAFCTARHVYAKLKITLHRKQRAFENFYSLDEEYGRKEYEVFQEEKRILKIHIKEKRQILYKVRAALNVLGYSNNEIV